MSLLHHACGLKNFSSELFAFLMGKRLLSTRKFNLSCSSWGCRVYLSLNSHTRLSQNQMGGWERWIPIENFTLPLCTLSIQLERRVSCTYVAGNFNFIWKGEPLLALKWLCFRVIHLSIHGISRILRMFCRMADELSANPSRQRIRQDNRSDGGVNFKFSLLFIWIILTRKA